MIKEKSKISSLFVTAPLSVVLAGSLFSWAIQFISHIEAKYRKLTEIISEEYDRLLLTGLIGGVVFYLFYNCILKTSSERWQKLLIPFLKSFNAYIFYLFLQGNDLELFFHILGVLILVLMLRVFNPLFCSELSYDSMRNVMVSLIIIGYFSLFEIFYEKQFDLFLITKAIGSLSFLAIPVLVLNRGKKLYLILLIIFLLVHSIPPLYHLYMFGSKMPTSGYYSIIESPHTEVVEYVYSAFNFKILALIISFALIPFLMLRMVRKENTNVKQKLIKNSGLLLSALLFIFSFGNENSSNNILFGYYQNFKEHSDQMRVFNLNAQKRKNSNNVFKGLKDIDSVKKRTFVLIVGESTSKHHMSLYDYYRSTNPELEKIREELYVFNNVISPHAHTQQTLEKVFTFANFEDMTPLFEEGSMIELFKQAGFKTYWLSNQHFLGENEYITTSIAKSANWSLFVDDPKLNRTESYDERLLSPLNILLKEDVDKKFIVIHLLGTHGDYAKRYPTDFNYYTDDNMNDIPTKNKLFLNDDWSKRKINEYDNAVMYNDHIVHEIIVKVSEMCDYSYVLYFSDHGEDVFDSRPYFSHQEASPTPFMFDIPFIAWFSKTYKKEWSSRLMTLSTYLSRKYQTDDLIHSVIDISNLQLDRFNPSKSIFSPQFNEERRFIGGKNYDQVAEEYEIFKNMIKRRK